MSCKCVNPSRFGLLCVALAMAGCAFLPDRQQASGERISGRLTLESGQLTLHPCAGGDSLTLVDTATLRQLYQRVASPGGPGLFADMTLQPPLAGAVQVLEVIRLRADGNGCADPVPARSQWVAVGEQPQWQVTTSPAGMQWQDETTGKSAAPLPVITEQVPGSALSFQTLRGARQELWLYPQGCFAQGSGDYYHRSARFTRDGQSLTGCAYQGLLP